MKHQFSLRLLSIFAFLLLMAPFYDSCSSHKGLFVKSYDVYNADGTPAVKSFPKKVYEVVVDELSYNGFEIASFTFFGIKDSTFIEFKEGILKDFQKDDWYKNLGLFISLIFGFIVLFSFSMIVLSFTKKNKFLNKLAKVNSILIIITFLYVIILESSFKHWSQIKWGYYAFILVQLRIYYSSNPKSQILNRK